MNTMAQKPYKEKLSRWVLLQRTVVVIFVVLAIADIASPQPCGEDLQKLFCPIANNQNQVNRAGVESGELPVLSVSLPYDRHSMPQQTDDDCFCCCAHVLPAVMFRSALSVPKTTVTCLHVESAPTPPLPTLYHPPRA
jgi:hypothetical protein